MSNAKPLRLSAARRHANATKLSRRGLLRLATGAAAGLTALSGCGEHVPRWLAARRGVAPLAAAEADTTLEVQDFVRRHPLPPRYRDRQTYLLQGVPSRELPTRLPDGRPLLWDLFGPTHTHVDAHTGWPWTRPGGDWIDAKGSRHGPVAWFSVPVGDALGADSFAHYFSDVTSLVRQSQTEDRWLALLLLARRAPRAISGTVGSRHGPPAIDVVYANGQRARLHCRVAGGLHPSTAYPNTAAAQVNLPACLEFERPAGPVSAATLRFTVTAHWSGPNPVIDGFLLDPPRQTDPPRDDGLARQTGALDAGLAAHPAVIGNHRYTDGSQLSDFVHADKAGLSSEQYFDPAIFGTGPQDLDKWPHAGLGKWLNAGSNWTLVPSSDRRDGFQPLAPGLGALRLHMPAAPQVRDGSVVGNNGTLAGNAMIFLPEPLFGRLDHIFVRYYLRLGLPGAVDWRERYQVRHTPGDSDWTGMAGKFGIGPDHSTSLGGVSGSSGGGAGWQMRLSWYECDAASGGPDERGQAPGFHLYDFQGNNPPGHRYGTEQSSQFERWGQRGGLGGMLYAGHWYCVETELHLNSVSLEAPGFLPDGTLRAWVDGHLVFERSGMVMRSLPIADAPHNPSRIRPCRELGVRGLWLNWFHGGQTVNTVDRTLFYTSLAWGKQYIGPMAR